MSEPAIYYPAGTQIIGVNRFGKVLIGIAGESGAGKSHLGNQLLRDPDYGPDEVLFLMAEDSTATYDMDKINVRPVKTFGAAMEVANDLARATAAGKRLPKVIFTDSLSGMADYQRQSYKEKPIMAWSDKKNEYVEDKRAQFGDMGYSGMDLVVRLRDDVAADVIVLMTTDESYGTVEMAIEGKLLPKNITRLTSVMLYLKPMINDVDPSVPVTPRPHRQIVSGTDPAGRPFNRVINRYFFTQNAGEVKAKGHHALDYQEPAYLPDILRKIHGKGVK